MKILIVDDDPQIEQLFQFSIMKEHEVKISHSVDEAVSLYSEFSPNIILSDIIMPGKTGIDLYNEIININSDQNFIFISACIEDEIRQKYGIPTQALFLQKPFRIKTLREMLESIA